MKQDKTRHIPRKAYFSPEESDEVDRKMAKAKASSFSEFVRALALGAPPFAHRIRRRGTREGPKLGPNLSEMFPARRGGAPTPLRL